MFARSDEFNLETTALDDSEVAAPFGTDAMTETGPVSLRHLVQWRASELFDGARDGVVTIDLVIFRRPAAGDGL